MTEYLIGAGMKAADIVMVLAPDHFMIDMYKRPKNRFFDWLIRTRRTRFVPRHGGLLVERPEGVRPEAPGHG